MLPAALTLVALIQTSAPSAPDLGAVPVVFEENRGQAPADYAFLARAGGGTVLVSATSLAFAPAVELDPSGRAPLARLELVGASGASRPVPEAPAKMRVSRFQGAEPCAWVQRAPSFERVRLPEVWPGIDAVVRAEGRSPRYDFELAPGADPAQVRLAFEGFEDAWIDDDGALVLAAEWGSWRHAAPRVTQQGPAGPEPVQGAFELRGEGTVGFRLGAYDRARPLLIDPTLSFLTLIGNESFEEANDVVSDGAGGWWVVGTTASLSFPYAAGHSAGPLASWDVFLLHFDGANDVSETILIGGSAVDSAVAVAVDVGTVYVAGNTSSNDFPVTPDAFQIMHMGNGDAFVLKLDIEIASLLYCTYYGGSGFDALHDFAVDAAAEPVLVGETGSPNLSVNGFLGTMLDGTSDAFAARLRSDGTDVVWSGYYGGAGRDRANAVALDPASTAFVVGERDSLASDSTAFVQEVEFDGDLGAEFLYGGSGFDEADDVIAYGPGSFTLWGTTDSADLALVDPFQAQLSGGPDAFLLAHDEFFGVLEASYFGGSGFDQAIGLAQDPLDGRYLLLLDTTSDDLPRIDALSAWPSEDDDVYLAAWSGIELEFATYLPGGDDEQAQALAIDADRRIAIVGSVENAADESDQPVNAVAGDTSGFDNENAFLALIDPQLTSGTPTISFMRANDTAFFDMPYEFFVYRQEANSATSSVDWVVYANTVLYPNLSGTITFAPGEHVGRGVVTIPSGPNGPGAHPSLFLANFTAALAGDTTARQLTLSTYSSGGGHGSGNGSSGGGCSLADTCGGTIEGPPPPWYRGLQNAWWIAALFAWLLVRRRELERSALARASRIAC